MKDGNFRIRIEQWNSTEKYNRWEQIFEFVFIADSGIDTQLAKDLVLAVEQQTQRTKKEERDV